MFKIEKIEMKKCSCCGELKELIEFHKDNNKKDGLTTQCKECRNKKQRKYSQTKRDENNNNKFNYTVYAHINKINNKIYIGATKDIVNRWGRGSGYKTHYDFYNDIQTYGWDNFEHEIIASGLTIEEAENFEILLISKLDTTNKDRGYNIANGGKSGNKGLDSASSREVFCNGKIFKSAVECANFLGVEDATLRSWIKGYRGVPDEYMHYNLHYIGDEVKLKRQNNNEIKVRCGNLIFNSMAECARYYNIKAVTMRAWLKGRNGTPQQFKDLGLQYATEEDLNTYDFYGKVN